MENDIETNDSPNVETDGQEPEIDIEPTEDVNALKEKIDELSGKNRQLFERAKKAEGFEKNSDGRWVKTHKPEPKPEPKPTPEPQSNEPDYAKLAFLNSQGVINPDAQKIVQDEADRLKLPLTDVLNMEHIKTKLKDFQDQLEAEAGMPKGKGKGSSGGKGRSEVDYWVDKKKPDGTYETPEDTELAAKVIEARISKEKRINQFSDELYVG